MGNDNDKNNKQSDSLFFTEAESDSDYKSLKKDTKEMCKCSYKNRLIFFVICFVAGWILSILGTLALILQKDITLFAVLFSLGQISNIIGSCFLAGPYKQMKSMIDAKRIVFSSLYIGFTIGTLVLAFVLPDNLKWIIIFSLIAQIISYFLYTISYIPFANKILKNICKICF